MPGVSTQLDAEIGLNWKWQVCSSRQEARKKDARICGAPGVLRVTFERLDADLWVLGVGEHGGAGDVASDQVTERG